MCLRRRVSGGYGCRVWHVYFSICSSSEVRCTKDRGKWATILSFQYPDQGLKDVIPIKWQAPQVSTKQEYQRKGCYLRQSLRIIKRWTKCEWSTNVSLIKRSPRASIQEAWQQDAKASMRCFHLREQERQAKTEDGYPM